MRIVQGAQMIATGNDDVTLADAKDDERATVVDRITHWRLPARWRGRSEKGILNLNRILQVHRPRILRRTSRRGDRRQISALQGSQAAGLASRTFLANLNAGNANSIRLRPARGPCIALERNCTAKVRENPRKIASCDAETCYGMRFSLFQDLRAIFSEARFSATVARFAGLLPGYDGERIAPGVFTEG
jgi:hypothetical protein